MHFFKGIILQNMRTITKCVCICIQKVCVFLCGNFSPLQYQNVFYGPGDICFSMFISVFLICSLVISYRYMLCNIYFRYLNSYMNKNDILCAITFC